MRLVTVSASNEKAANIVLAVGTCFVVLNTLPEQPSEFHK